MGLPCSICVHCGGIHRTSPVFDAIAPAYPSKTSRGPLTRSLGMLCADSSLSAVLPQARGLRHPSSAWWRRLARPPTLTPPPPLPEAWEFRGGLPALLPTPLASQQDASRVRHGRRKRQAGGGVWLACPRRSLRLPCLPPGEDRLPWSPWASAMALVPTRVSLPHFRVGLAGILGQGCQGLVAPEGSARFQCCTMAVRSQAPTSWGLASPAWGLSGACCSPRRVVDDAELHGLSGYLYTRRGYPMLPCRFHGAPRGTSEGWRQSAPYPCSAQSW